MKKVLITGANKGIGFETAKQLAQLGYFVFLGCRDHTQGQKALKDLHDSGLSNTCLIVINVSDAESIQRARIEIQTKTDHLDILINNAGIAGDQPQNFSNCPIEELRRIFETNYFGVIKTTQEFLPLLRKAENASIINVSSEVGSLTMNAAPDRNPNWSNFHFYGSSKTALNAFTIALARELKDSGINVNSVTPGYTATDLNKFQGAKTAEQGAKPIVQLATEPGLYTTGGFFKDGGEVAW